MHIKSPSVPQCQLFEHYSTSRVKRARFTIRRFRVNRPDSTLRQQDHKRFCKPTKFSPGFSQANPSSEFIAPPFGDYGDLRSGDNQTVIDATHLNFPGWNTSSSENPFIQDLHRETISFQLPANGQIVNNTFSGAECERKKVKSRARCLKHVGDKQNRLHTLINASKIQWNQSSGRGRLFVDFQRAIFLTPTSDMQYTKRLSPNIPLRLLDGKGINSRSRSLDHCHNHQRPHQQKKQNAANELSPLISCYVNVQSDEKMNQSTETSKIGKIFRLVRATPIRLLPVLFCFRSTQLYRAKLNSQPIQLVSCCVIVDCLQKRPYYTVEFIRVRSNNDFLFNINSCLGGGRILPMQSCCPRPDRLHRAYSHQEVVYMFSIVTTVIKQNPLQIMYEQPHETLPSRDSPSCLSKIPPELNSFLEFSHKNSCYEGVNIELYPSVWNTYNWRFEIIHQSWFCTEVLRCCIDIQHSQDSLYDDIMFIYLPEYQLVPLYTEIKRLSPLQSICSENVPMENDSHILSHGFGLIKAAQLNQTIHYSLDQLIAQHLIIFIASVFSKQKPSLKSFCKFEPTLFPHVTTPEITEIFNSDTIAQLFPHTSRIPCISYEPFTELTLFTRIPSTSNQIHPSWTSSSFLCFDVLFIPDQVLRKSESFRSLAQANKRQQLASHRTVEGASNLIWLRWFRQCTVITLSGFVMRCGMFGFKLYDLIPLTGVFLALVACGLLCYKKMRRL